MPMMWCSKHKKGYLGSQNDDCDECRAEKVKIEVAKRKTRTRLGKVEKCTILNALQMQAEIQSDGGDAGEARRARDLLDKLVAAPDWSD